MKSWTMALLGAAVGLTVVAASAEEKVEVPKEYKAALAKAESEKRSFFIWPAEEALYSIDDLGSGLRIIRVPLNYVRLKRPPRMAVSVLRMKVTPTDGGTPVMIYETLDGPPEGDSGKYTVHYSLDLKDLHGTGRLAVHLGGQGDSDVQNRFSNGLTIDIEL
jgi:hypothetical protein